MKRNEFLRKQFETYVGHRRATPDDVEPFTNSMRKRYPDRLPPHVKNGQLLVVLKGLFARQDT